MLPKFLVKKLVHFSLTYHYVMFFLELSLNILESFRFVTFNYNDFSATLFHQFHSPFCSQKSLDVGLNWIGGSLWLVVLDDVSVAIDQEFAKIPPNLCLGLTREPLVQIACGWSFHINLAKDGESDSILFRHVRNDGIFWVGLLTTKLIAREGKNLQPARLHSTIQGLILTVVRGQTSLWSNVNTEGGLCIATQFTNFDRILRVSLSDNKVEKFHQSL